ncbi:MAG: hypothetical protein LBS18_08435 [Clostridiales bacterium]|jgi:hypothetical protein|nr:hypothetical protein [Clostridiales bacterium]
MSHIKGCKKCGAGALSSDEYCPVCGTKFDMPQKQEQARPAAYTGRANRENAAGVYAGAPYTRESVQSRHEKHVQMAPKKKKRRPTLMALLVALVLVGVVGGIYFLADFGEQTIAPTPRGAYPVAYEAYELIIPVTRQENVPPGYMGIYTKEDLRSIGEELTGNFILMNDIDLGGAELKPWTPIGADPARYYTSLTDYDGFSGVLDGNGHTISNLYVSIKDVEQKQVVCAGLFALTLNATIRNLTVTGTVEITGHIGEYTYAGGISGACVATGGRNVIRNCAFAGRISQAEYAGGITGIVSAYDAEAEGIVTLCTSNGDITGGKAGGIVGFQNAMGEQSRTTVAYSRNYGNVHAVVSTYNFAGGISGGVQSGQSGAVSTILGCENKGQITGNDRTGGICGSLTAINGARAIIENSYNRGDVVGKKYASGIAANCYTGEARDEIYISRCYNSGAVSGDRSGRRAIAYADKDELMALTDCYYTGNSGCKDTNATEMTDAGIGGYFITNWPWLFSADESGALPAVIPELEFGA